MFCFVWVWFGLVVLDFAYTGLLIRTTLGKASQPGSFKEEGTRAGAGYRMHYARGRVAAGGLSDDTAMGDGLEDT